ncbi:hypothetical protein C0Q70_05317 [Pomacea canaliculata]|uniref:Uncharacterized protein n=1 Tax=Pomacea canaliculata TaxID=400727 RepID=A0A2T7PKU5_POMCA|nr:hypothetical protein C0Q70_05317 [Pomacea canaliculata]
MMPFSISKKQTPMVDTKYGKYPRGSTLAHQQKLHDSFIMNFTELATFPDLPLRNVMSGDIPDLSEEKKYLLTSLKVTQQESVVIERDTRLQSNCPLWHKLRQHRITASVVADVAKRKKDFQALSKRLKSSKTKMTQAMKDGIKNEPLAAEAYSNMKGILSTCIQQELSYTQMHSGWQQVQIEKCMTSPEHKIPLDC